MYFLILAAAWLLFSIIIAPLVGRIIDEMGKILTNET